MACPGCSPDCAPNLVACMGIGQRIRKVAHGKVPCIDNNAAELPCERRAIKQIGWYMCSHVPTMKPPSGPKALKQMQHVVPSNTNLAGAVQSFCGGSARSWQLVAFSKSHPSAFQSRMVWPPAVLVVRGSSHGNMSSGLIHDVSPQSR